MTDPHDPGAAAEAPLSAASGADPARAAALVRGAYRHLARGDRFHVEVRWRSCPFGEVERRVPRQGRILDLGCGHGAFALYMAARAPARGVTGTDVDAAKLAAARRAAGHANLPATFVEAVDGALPAGPSEPNSEGALAGIVGSTKIGSVGKSVSGGGGAPPVPPRPPVPTMTMPPLPLAPAVPGLPPPPMPGFPVPAVPVGDCDDPTFAQANAQRTARTAALRMNALRNLLVLLITTAADGDW